MQQLKLRDLAALDVEAKSNGFINNLFVYTYIYIYIIETDRERERVREIFIICCDWKFQTSYVVETQLRW